VVENSKRIFSCVNKEPNKPGTIFAIKTKVAAPQAKTFAFSAQKTMYGGKLIATGDTIFVFASENEGGSGLVASGIVTAAKAIPRKPGIARQTPRVSITIRRTALARRRLGRTEFKRFSDWRRPARDRAQFQILPPGHEQDCRAFRCSGGVPPRILLKTLRKSGGTTSVSSDIRVARTEAGPRLGRRTAG
jgi:hypothetical protein